MTRRPSEFAFVVSAGDEWTVKGGFQTTLENVEVALRANTRRSRRSIRNELGASSPGPDSVVAIISGRRRIRLEHYGERQRRSIITVNADSEMVRIKGVIRPRDLVNARPYISSQRGQEPEHGVLICNWSIADGEGKRIDFQPYTSNVVEVDSRLPINTPGVYAKFALEQVSSLGFGNHSAMSIDVSRYLFDSDRLHKLLES